MKMAVGIFQMTFLNQTWLRYNPVQRWNHSRISVKKDGFDIDLRRRTRIQMFGQISDRTFLYLQLQNNFNAQTNLNGNRKNVAFFHDAVWIPFEQNKINSNWVPG